MYDFTFWLGIDGVIDPPAFYEREEVICFTPDFTLDVVQDELG